MPSRMSLLNKELCLQIARSTGWISLIYFLTLLFAIPLQLLVRYANEDRALYFQKVDSLFQFEFSVQLVLFIAIPIGLSVFLFRFLHVKQATDLMHSLPLKRETLFHHYALTGMAFLITPVILVSAITLLIHSALGLGSVFSAVDIVKWAGVTTIVNLLLYTSGVFVAMMTGISVVHAVLSYIFMLFPAGFTLLLFFNFKMLLYGFPSDYFLNKDLEKMSPLTYAAVLEGRPFQWGQAVLYTAIMVLLYTLALFFYKKRKLEAASEAIAFTRLRAVFKYGVTFCTMLTGGMYFSLVPYSSLVWVIFGYAVGAIIGYFIAEMILRKSWRVFDHIKGLAIYSVLITILLVSIQTLGVYENRIPEQSEIKSVLLTENSNLFLNQAEVYEEYFIPKPLTEQENIEAVRKLHGQIIADKNANRVEKKNVPYQIAFLMYELKNGDKIIREYRVNQEIYGDLLKPIYESEEFKRKSKELFKVKDNQVELMKIRSNGYVDKVVTISEPEEVKEALAALKADELAETYEDGKYYQGRGSSIEIELENKQWLNLEFKPSYERFTKWLEEKDMLDRARVTSEDISHVLVSKGQFSNLESNYDQIKMEMESDGDALKITDKPQIDLALNRAGWNYYKQDYAAVFYYEDGRSTEMMFFDERHVPEFVKEYFQ